LSQQTLSVGSGSRDINFGFTPPDVEICSFYSNLGATPGLAGCTCLEGLQGRQMRFFTSLAALNLKS
jgi:hypothetical protein